MNIHREMQPVSRNFSTSSIEPKEVLESSSNKSPVTSLYSSFTENSLSTSQSSINFSKKTTEVSINSDSGKNDESNIGNMKLFKNNLNDSILLNMLLNEK